jgi:nicotinate-nucleotide adenylyltransferase
MRIGLLLGSFDPIHIAHINIAACAINSGLCDKVLFVVAKHNPWKENEPTPFELRCKMIEAAIVPLGDKAEVCRLEEGIEPPTYSYKVISLIREQYPEDEIYLLAGSDTIDNVPHWKNFETHIKDKIGFIEVLRGHDSLISDEPIPFKVQCEAVSTCMKVTVLETQKLDVSSTLVRKMVHDGMNPYPYITKEVLQIINENNLYQNG